MIIIKKSGRAEDFSEKKVRLSIAYASEDAGQPMNESDLNRIMKDLADVIGGREQVKSEHLQIIVMGLLRYRGYDGVLDAYVDYYRHNKAKA